MYSMIVRDPEGLEDLLRTLIHWRVPLRLRRGHTRWVLTVPDQDKALLKWCAK